MSNETQAASSPAVDPFQGNEPTLSEYNQYRETGELPDRYKPVETEAEGTADAPEETVDAPASDPESDPEEAQEQPPKGSAAQKRILQLLAENKRLKLEATAKPDVTPAPSPEQHQQQPQTTRPKPTVEATDQDGKPKYATYEDYVEDLADWKAEQQVVRYQQAQQQQEALKVLKSKLDEARTRYADADAVIFPAAQVIRDAQIPPAVKEIFAGSEYFTDLCYVVGSDPAELTAFVSLAQTNPRAALAKVFEYENGIKAELTKGKDGNEPNGGKAPEKKPTTAPKPPSPVSGGSSRAFDVSDESLTPEAWAAKRNKQAGK
jgi:hypothetical protein